MACSQNCNYGALKRQLVFNLEFIIWTWMYIMYIIYFPSRVTSLDSCTPPPPPPLLKWLLRPWLSESSGVARILFLGGPGQKWAGTRLTNWSSPVRKSAAPNRELSGGWVEGLVIRHNILNICFKPGRRGEPVDITQATCKLCARVIREPLNLSRFTRKLK